MVTPGRPGAMLRLQVERPVNTHGYRLALLATLVLFAATWTGAAPAHSVTTAAVKPTQKLVVLLSAHQAFSKPAQGSAPVAMVPARRPLTGERTVLPVLGEPTGAVKLGWLRVRLPGRPNGHTGWIRQRGTFASTTSWHLVVHTSTRRVIVYQKGRPVRTVKAVVGKASTPTPHGEFFVEEAIQLRAGDVGAPYALALSARSNVLQELEGGPGQIGFHGLSNVGGVLGSAVSHGCVRLDNATMRWRVFRVGPGAPVTITS
jgi:lipoprotein-anchoring transpeptidase ErfK/SrfK